MKKLTIAALLTVGLAGFTYAAMADNHRGPGGAMLEEVDTNLDGNITKDELSAHRAERFFSADTNGDNLVSPDEFEAFTLAERERKQAERQAKRFERLDANGDGLITADEHDAAAAKRMDRMFDRITLSVEPKAELVWRVAAGASRSCSSSSSSSSSLSSLRRSSSLSASLAAPAMACEISSATSISSLMSSTRSPTVSAS